MIFDTFWFLCFAAVFLTLYWLFPIVKLRLLLLLSASMLFHFHFAGPAGVLPIIIMGTLTYFIALAKKPRLAVLGICFCLGALIFYKYWQFLLHSLMLLVKIPNPDGYETLFPAAVPLAISFFVFEYVHYLSDVHRGSEPIKSPVRFALFSIFFPSLVAGPIKRYLQFQESLENGLKCKDSSYLTAGLVLVMSGYLKKVLLADNFARFATTQGAIIDGLNLLERWQFLIALSLRIYFDFSAYSDIAIGLALAMGIELPANFNWPYLALNLKDFWRRWHISLSTWIRDYVYVPLGGGRLGLLKTSLNGALAFALCGLWHGAHWHYVFWGLYHGFGLAVCNSYKNHTGPLGANIHSIFQKAPLLSWLLTYLFVAFGWLFFFYPVKEALKMLRLLFGG